MATAFEDNDSLVKEYHRIQQQFMKEKAEALKVIERKLELETSLHDHVQVITTRHTMFKLYTFQLGYTSTATQLTVRTTQDVRGVLQT